MAFRGKRIKVTDFGFTIAEVLGKVETLPDLERIKDGVKKDSVRALEMVTEAGLVVPRPLVSDASANPIKDDVPIRY